jgi:hypothetical protein
LQSSQTSNLRLLGIFWAAGPDGSTPSIIVLGDAGSDFDDSLKNAPVSIKLRSIAHLHEPALPSSQSLLSTDNCKHLSLKTALHFHFLHFHSFLTMKYLQLLALLLPSVLGLAQPRDRDPSKSSDDDLIPEPTETESSSTSHVPTPTFFLTQSCFPTATIAFNTTTHWYQQSCTFIEHTKTITTTTYKSACKTVTASAVPTCDDHGVDGRC